MVIQATLEQVPQVAELFDLYRQFYDQPADFPKAEAFIRARLENEESTIFLAYDEGVAVGMVQLYPSFCSVEAIKIQILYDLYVRPDFRRRGLAEKLMNRAAAFAVERGAGRVDLLTGTDNRAGQALYQKLAYVRSLDDFIGYSLELNDA